MIKAGARKLHMHCNQRSFVETEFGSFFKLFAEIKFCVFNCLGLFWNLFESEFSKIIFFFFGKRGRVWFSYYLVGILQLQTILFCSRSIDIFVFCISMSQLVQLLYTMYFQTDICSQKHVVNGSRMGGFLDRQ